MRFFSIYGPAAMMPILASALALSAQEPPRPRPFMDPAQRAKLEMRWRQETEQLLRDKLKLTDDQVKKLRALDARMQPLRNKVRDELHAVYAETEKEVARGDAANQKRVGELMQQSTMLRKRYMDVIDEEQRELLTFLTPVQASQYISIQKQLREKIRQKTADEPKRPVKDRRGDELRRPEGDRRMPFPPPPRE